MSGVGLAHDFDGVEALRIRVRDIGQFDRHDLLDIIGATVESQTRRRIEDDKSSPVGVPWAAWSEAYADTRHSGHSLLEGEGHLLASMTHTVGLISVEVGSNQVYAATHQFGDPGRNIPARPSLGLSSADAAELETDILAFLRRITP